MTWFLTGLCIGFTIIVMSCMAEHYFIECSPFRFTLLIAVSCGLGHLVGWFGYAEREVLCVIGSWVGVVGGSYWSARWRKNKNENK